jgi:hypothetical protein
MRKRAKDRKLPQISIIGVRLARTKLHLQHDALIRELHSFSRYESNPVVAKLISPAQRSRVRIQTGQFANSATMSSSTLFGLSTGLMDVRLSGATSNNNSREKLGN